MVIRVRSLIILESVRGLATIPQGVRGAVLFSLAEQRDLQRISNRRLVQGAVGMCGPVRANARNPFPVHSSKRIAATRFFVPLVFHMLNLNNTDEFIPL